MQPRQLRTLARQTTAAIFDDAVRSRAMFQMALLEYDLKGDPFAALREAIRLMNQCPGPEAAVLYAELALVLNKIGRFTESVLQKAEEVADFDRASEVCIFLAGAACGWRTQLNLSAAEGLAADACPPRFTGQVRQSVAHIHAMHRAYPAALAVTRRIVEPVLQVQTLAHLSALPSGPSREATCLLAEATRVVEALDRAKDRCLGQASLARARHARREYSGGSLRDMQTSFDEIRSASERGQLAPIVAGTLAQHGALAAAIGLAASQSTAAQTECHLAICEQLAIRGDVGRTRDLAQWAMLPGYRDRALLTIVTAASRAARPRFFLTSVVSLCRRSPSGSEPPCF